MDTFRLGGLRRITERFQGPVPTFEYHLSIFPIQATLPSLVPPQRTQDVSYGSELLW